MNEEERKEWWAGVKDVIETAEKLKKVMLKRGLRRARAKCPRCSSDLYGSLNGTRNHLHMACEGKCGMQMME